MAVILANAEFAAPLTEHEVLVFLIQLLVLVGVARLFGWVMKSINQPPVVGELLAGVVLGPTVLGSLAPGVSQWIFGEATVDSVIFGLSWLGVIMLLIVIGFETDLAIIVRFRTAALGVSAGALLLPLIGFFLVAHLVPDSFLGESADVSVFAGFFALAFSVSALPVVAKILQDLGYLRRNFGQITLAAGMTIDSVGWLILAALSGIAQDGFQPVELARSFGGLLVFLLVAATVGRWFVDRLFRFVMARGSSVTAALSITLVAALIGGVTTQSLRLEAILGAFIVGVILAGTRHQLPQVRSTLETVTAAFFAPIFFAYSGLRVDVGLLNSGAAVAWTVGLIVAAIAAKIIGTALGGFFAGIRGREALALGSGLSALGAMGIVVAIVGLNLGVVSETGYTVMVLAALVTSVVSPQFLRAAVSGWQVPVEEAERLEREELKDASEILSSDRILLPTAGRPQQRLRSQAGGGRVPGGGDHSAGGRPGAPVRLEAIVRASRGEPGSARRRDGRAVGLAQCSTRTAPKRGPGGHDRTGGRPRIRPGRVGSLRERRILDLQLCHRPRPFAGGCPQPGGAVPASAAMCPTSFPARCSCPSPPHVPRGRPRSWPIHSPGTTAVSCSPCTWLPGPRVRE